MLQQPPERRLWGRRRLPTWAFLGPLEDPQMLVCLFLCTPQQKGLVAECIGWRTCSQDLIRPQTGDSVAEQLCLCLLQPTRQCRLCLAGQGSPSIWLDDAGQACVCSGRSGEQQSRGQQPHSSQPCPAAACSLVRRCKRARRQGGACQSTACAQSPAPHSRHQLGSMLAC